MTKTLRPYQESAIQNIALSFSKLNKRVILCMPTGAGKSLVFSRIATLTAAKGNKVLILTHRIELKSQAESYGSNCRVIMVETLNNRIKENPDFLIGVHLIIIDECHIGNFKKILDIAPSEVYVIGCTATPIAKPPLNKYYSDIVEPVDVAELITTGYLAKPKSYQKKIKGIDFDSLVIKQGEFTPESLGKQFNQIRNFGGVVQDYIEKGSGCKAIVFCCSIDHSVNVATEFENNVINPVYCIHSKQKKEDRQKSIEAFLSSPNGILVNCGIATTGFDCPDIRIVIVNRATLSLPLWMQMCGRGSRVIPLVKTEFEIWDYGDNIARLGHWEQRINWKQVFNEPEKVRKSIGMQNLKECDGCAARIATSARFCQYCGATFEVAAKDILEGELTEVDYRDVALLNGRKLFSLSVVELAQLVKYKKLKKVYFEMVLYFSGRLLELEQYWNDKEYKIGYRKKRIEFFGTFTKGLNDYAVRI
jgi:superfamily II DNA or RNA helicase